MKSELIKPNHLDRKAVVYVRQSSPQQVINNQESLRLQYALRQRARELGWHEGDIDVIDADLGLSGAGASHQQGFKDLVARVTLGEIGLILSIEVTRLARNCSDWYPLLDVCGHRSCLIGDRDGIYDPGTPNGRLLLGLKGTISELELHTIRGRLTAGLLAKAERGELAQQLPTGFVRDPSGVVTQDTNREVQERIALLFECFLGARTAAKVMRTFTARGLALPRRDRDGEIMLEASNRCGHHLRAEESSLCWCFCLRSDVPKAVEPSGSSAGQVAASGNGLEDRGQEQISRLHKLGDV
jgi:DNA invertase Pin-like site-specific DNA recombinase